MFALCYPNEVTEENMERAGEKCETPAPEIWQQIQPERLTNPIITKTADLGKTEGS